MAAAEGSQLGPGTDTHLWAFSMLHRTFTRCAGRPARPMLPPGLGTHQVKNGSGIDPSANRALIAKHFAPHRRRCGTIDLPLGVAISRDSRPLHHRFEDEWRSVYLHFLPYHREQRMLAACRARALLRSGTSLRCRGPTQSVRVGGRRVPVAITRTGFRFRNANQSHEYHEDQTQT